jgi:hypothetical protein
LNTEATELDKAARRADSEREKEKEKAEKEKEKARDKGRFSSYHPSSSYHLIIHVFL